MPKIIPDKLERDAIIEAVFELRFHTVTIPEVLFGRLADVTDWREFEQRKLPMYDIPAAIRQADPNLRFQSIIELRNDTKKRLLRIGPNVLSYHLTEVYSGWTAFRPELIRVITELFQKTQKLVVSRLGLRYVNVLMSDVHGIASLKDLDLVFTVEGAPIAERVNINYMRDMSDHAQSTVRIATKDFAQGNIPPSGTVIVDVDVSTPDSFAAKTDSQVIGWLDDAHRIEKEQFFKLLPQPTIDRLKAK